MVFKRRGHLNEGTREFAFQHILIISGSVRWVEEVANGKVEYIFGEEVSIGISFWESVA